MEDPKPVAAEEVRWIKDCQAGDREAFANLVGLYQRRIFSLVYHLVRRPDEIEDIVQEIFIKAFSGIRSYNFRSSFRTWLSRIAVNHCYDYLRRSRSSRVRYFWQFGDESERRVEALAESADPDDLPNEERVIQADLVHKLLARAPAEDRTVLVLKEIEDRSVEEIAEVMKLNQSTVKVRLHRARKRMLKDLDRLRQGR
jgi:RNA polymerase sigma-70 factor, ECF subfamily